MDRITLDSVIFAPVTLYLENWINIVMLLETDDDIGHWTYIHSVLDVIKKANEISEPTANESIS